MLRAKESFALVLKRIPTPPVAAPASFMVAEVVMRVLPWILSYLTSSSCTNRCSCKPSMSISLYSEVGYKFFLASLLPYCSYIHSSNYCFSLTVDKTFPFASTIIKFVPPRQSD